MQQRRTEKWRQLSWEQARAEWTEAHREEYEKFLFATLSFPEATAGPDESTEEQRLSEAGDMLSKLPHRPGG